MADNEDMQKQIDEVNQKLDRVLEYVNDQRLKRDMANDFLSDASIIGKDAWDTIVEELDRAGVEVNIEDLKYLLFKVLKNLRNFHETIEVFESAMDFMKDAGPISKEVIIEFINKLHELENKGYFEFLSEATKVMDAVVTNFSKEDLNTLSANMGTIMQTMKDMTQPEVLQAVDSAAKTLGSMDMENVPEYSVWKLARTMNKPEMKKAMGFMVTFLNQISQNQNYQNQTPKN